MVWAADSVGEFVAWIDAKLEYLNSAEGERTHCIYWSSVWDDAVASVYSLGLVDVAESLGGELPAYGCAGDVVTKALRDQLRNRLVELRLKLTGSNGPNTTKPDKSGHPKKAGRKKADYNTVQREAQIAADWERARDAGTYKADFARDNGLIARELDALLDRVAWRQRNSE